MMNMMHGGAKGIIFASCFRDKDNKKEETPFQSQ